MNPLIMTGAMAFVIKRSRQKKEAAVISTRRIHYLKPKIHFRFSTINRLIGFDCMKNQTATFTVGKSIGKVFLAFYFKFIGSRPPSPTPEKQAVANASS